MRTLILISALLFIQGCMSASAPTQYLDTPTVGFSELVDNPIVFDHKIVRVSATYTCGFEASMLRVSESGAQVWVEFDSSFSNNTDPGVLRVFNSLLRRHRGKEFTTRSARIIAVGRFSGVKPIQRFPGLEVPKGFGHLNSYDMMFTILAIEEAKWSPW